MSTEVSVAEPEAGVMCIDSSQASATVGWCLMFESPFRATVGHACAVEFSMGERLAVTNRPARRYGQAAESKILAGLPC
ncbi:MAG: hypothetical protein WA988_05075 [Candidatus Nanopelagicales bacterium]